MIVVKNLKYINLKSFNTKNVINMNFMFQHCINLNQIDLSSFDFNNISIRYIFCRQSPLKVILKKKYKNILINDPNYRDYISEIDLILI